MLPKDLRLAGLRNRELSRRGLLRGGLLLGGAATAVSLAGCAPGGPSGDGTLNLGVFSHFEELDKRLAASNWTGQVTWESLVADTHRDQLIAAFRSGESPWDVVPLWSFLTPEMAHNGWITDLTDLITDEFGPDFVEIVGNKSPFANGIYQNRMWAVPVDVGGTILHWNKDLLAERGLDPEAPNDWHSTPGSIDEFVGYAKELTFEKDGVPHWGLSENWGDQAALSFNTFQGMFGGESMNLNGDDPYGKITFNESPGVDALQFMVDLLHKHKVVDPASVTYDWVFDITPGFLDGRVGFIITWPFVAAAAKDPEQSTIANAGFAPNFSAVTSATSQDPHYLAIPSNNPAGLESAWDYVKFRISYEMEREQGIEGAWAPIYADLYEDPGVRASFIQADAIAASLQYPSSLSATPDYMEWRTILNASISRALRQEMTPKQALDSAAEEVADARKA